MAGGMQGGYTPPVPARRQGANSLLIWSLVGCGVIALLVVVIGGVMATRFMKKSGAGGMFSVMAAMPHAAEKVEKVEAGIEEYRKDHNDKYPATLEALVPKYVSDKSAFICGESDAPKPMEYAPPKPGASEGTVVISVHIGDIPIMNTQLQKMYVCLLKNGEVVSEQQVRTILSQHGKRLTTQTRTY